MAPQSTEVIVTAKHGQSPIDPARLAKIGDKVSPVLTNAGVGIAQVTVRWHLAAARKELATLLLGGGAREGGAS